MYLQTSGQAEAQRLDELLWTFNDRSFLPHEIYAGAAASHAMVMVLLGERGRTALAPTARLINLTDCHPRRRWSSTSAIAEIVDVDPERKRTARERYRQYRERGCTLESHNL